MFVLINLKAYNCDPVAIAQAAEQVTVPDDVTVAIAPQTAQLRAVADTGIETWSQHVHGIEHGSHTGHTIPEAVAAAGGAGTLLNHSEQRLRLADIDAGIEAAQRAGLDTVVCANTPAQVGAVARLGPDAVAIEPPELIGTGTPVSQADPDVVTDAVDAATAIDSSVGVLCGAGISTAADIQAAAELGADGVLLASGVAKAADPKQALAELVEGLNR